jgi:hypothetical protein
MAFGESCGVAAVWVIIGGTIAIVVSATIKKKKIRQKITIDSYCAHVI